MIDVWADWTGRYAPPPPARPQRRHVCQTCLGGLDVPTDDPQEVAPCPSCLPYEAGIYRKASA